MAYKFQLGDSRLSGSLVQEGDVDVADGGLKIAGTEIVTSARVLQNLSDVASIAGGGLVNNSGVLDVNVDDASIEINSDTLRIKANGIDDLHIDWGTGTNQVNTDDMPEGSTNLWYTDARVRAAVSEDAYILDYDSGTGVMSVTAANLTSSVRGAISVTDAGGDGSMSYDSGTGVLTYTGPSAAEVRAHLSAGDMLDFSGGEFSVNAAAFTASWDLAIAARDTDNLAEGASNLYFTNARARSAISEDAFILDYDSGTGVMSVTEANLTSSVRGAISVTDAGGDGSMSYDSGTGVITYTGPSAAEVRAHLSAGDMLDFSGGEFSVVPALFTASFDLALAARDTDNLAEGATNLYYTDARARAAVSEDAFILDYDSGTGVMSVTAANLTSSIRGAVSVTDAGGDGSLAYNSSTGVFTYTGPSAAEVRAHFSVTDTDTIDMTLSNGDIQGSLKFDPTSFTADGVGGLQLSGAVAGAGIALSAGVLSMDISEFADVAVASGDKFLMLDSDGSTEQLESVDDLAAFFAGNGLSSASGVMALDLNELAASTVNVAADSIAIIDADDSNASKKESIADLVSAMAGAGLTATNGVLSADSSVAPTAVGDADANLVEGFNYGNASLTAARTWSLPAPSEAGDIVHVKAPDNCSSTNTITIDGGTIDGESSIVLESPHAAVSLICIDVGSDLWKLY